MIGYMPPVEQYRHLLRITLQKRQASSGPTFGFTTSGAMQKFHDEFLKLPVITTL